MVIVGMFLTWLPHYLCWPWWADVEHFALSALSWEAGILPYRDLYDFNFPGPMYFHWVLGKVFGWGRTIPFYLVDVSLLSGFLGVAVHWSRTRLGGVTPALVTALVGLAYYCNLNYAMAAQRDWQVPLLAAMGLMTLESRPGRLGRWIAATCFVVAFSFRPHVVVFGPAYLAALDENARGPGGSWRSTVCAVLEWCLVTGAGCALVFAPLLLTGTLDDFLVNFREALHGGGYETTGRRSFLKDVADQLNQWEIVAAMLGLTATAGFAEGSTRRVARTWLLAFGFVLVYRPLSPVAHGYLIHPLKITWAVSIGLIASGLIRSARLSPVVKILGVTAILLEAIPRIPLYCQPERLGDPARSLWRGVPTASAPPGTEREFSPASSNPYQWGDYQRVLEYLRRHTHPKTRVANFFRGYPFPTVNAPVGRLSPFPSVAGVLWLRWVDEKLETEFATRLEPAGDTVVVWIPGEPPTHGRLRLRLVERTIRHYYALEARIGKLEIWRRRSDVSVSASREFAPLPEVEPDEEPHDPGSVDIP
jgi:hypothetical protein